MLLLDWYARIGLTTNMLSYDNGSRAGAGPSGTPNASAVTHPAQPIQEPMKQDLDQQTTNSLRQALMDPILGARRRLARQYQQLHHSSSNNSIGQTTNDGQVVPMEHDANGSVVVSAGLGRHLRPLAESFYQYLDSSSGEPSPSCSPMASPRNSPYMARRAIARHSSIGNTLSLDPGTPPTPPTTPTGIVSKASLNAKCSANVDFVMDAWSANQVRSINKAAQQDIQCHSGQQSAIDGTISSANKTANATCATKSRMPTFKFDVANSDINAVGPSSW